MVVRNGIAERINLRDHLRVLNSELTHGVLVFLSKHVIHALVSINIKVLVDLVAFDFLLRLLLGSVNQSCLGMFHFFFNSFERIDIDICLLFVSNSGLIKHTHIGGFFHETLLKVVIKFVFVSEIAVIFLNEIKPAFSCAAQLLKELLHFI